MKLLGLDTTSDACSCALSVGGQIIERYQLAPRQHTKLILPMVEAVLAEAGMKASALDGLAFGCGPGAFTGIRIGTGVIQGLALGLGIKVARVSSLQALAQGVLRTHGCARVLAALDARMDEVYWGVYEADADGIMRVLGEDQLSPPEAVSPPPAGDWVGAGRGWGSYESALITACGHPQDCFPEEYPHAQDVALLGATLFAEGLDVVAEEALPVYLRDQVAQVPKAEKEMA